MKKVIVTGSAGFIGRALCQRLREMGVQVIGIDRKPSPHHYDRQMEAEEIYRFTEKGDIDCVFHLAAQTSVFNQDLRQICNDNITTFVEVVEACRRDNVPLVYASSSTANPCNTSSLYGLSKRFDEEFAMCYYENAIGVRFHNVYGPNPRKDTLLWHILNDERVTLYNEGKNYRHFTYIDDIIDGLITAPALIGEHPIVNIANPEVTTTLEFCWRAAIELERRECGLSIKFECVPDVRDRDHVAQKVDDGIFTMPLTYTTVADGMSKLFALDSTIEALQARH